MKLLHTEIDVVPGRKPQKQPLPEGFVGAGTAVLRITNTTSRQNAYTVRIRCEEPYWQDSWFQVSALPPTGGPENQPPAGKPDQPGPRNQSMTIYVQDGGTRDIFLSFFVPEKSECRSAAYPVKVVVETRIVSNDPQLARKERITEIPALVIVRPFYKWAMSYQPDNRKVGFFKRGKEYELVVDNQSNDWLYCDLKLPRPQNVLVETKTVRLAIPPPEPGADSVRTVPFKGISRVRAVRGEHQVMPIPITVHRVHAPTVPPLPEDAQFGPSGANAGAAVVETETQDLGNPEIPATITYCPLIPATLTGFFQAVGRNFRGILMFVVGFIIAYNLAVFSWKYFFDQAKLVNISTMRVDIGKPFYISGKNLVGAKVYVYDETGRNQLGQVKAVPQLDNMTEPKLKVTLQDTALDHKKVKFGVQRGGWATLLDRFLPVEIAIETVEVGIQPEAPSGPPAGNIPQTIKPGADLTIGGVNFGKDKGEVLLNGQKAVIKTWTESQIVVRIPHDLQDGNPISILVANSKHDPIPLNTSSFAVMDLSAPPGEGMDGGGAGTGGGDTDPGGADSGSGGNVSPPPSTSGGGTGSGGSTGGGTAAAAMDTPPGYADLLSDTRQGYLAAINHATGQSAGALAVKAYAYASIGKLDDARRVFTEANQKAKSGSIAETMVYIAAARLMEKLAPDQAAQAYMNIDLKAGPNVQQWAFIDIAQARFKIAQGEWNDAKILLDNTDSRSPTAAEKQAIKQMQAQVAAKRKSP